MERINNMMFASGIMPDNEYTDQWMCRLQHDGLNCGVCGTFLWFGMPQKWSSGLKRFVCEHHTVEEVDRLKINE